MAIAFRAAQRDTGGTGTSRAFTAPASRVAGDCLLLDAEIVSLTATINTPAGWNVSIPSTASTDQTTNARFWRVATADASDSGTLTWTGGASIFADSVMCAYSGCDTTNPVNASSSAMQNNAASTSAPVSAITTTADNCLPVTVVHNNQGQSVTPAAGWTEDTDTTGGPEVAHKNSVITPAGTTGSVTHTLGGSFKSATGMTALQPPATGVTVTAPAASATASAPAPVPTVVIPAPSATATAYGVPPSRIGPPAPPEAPLVYLALGENATLGAGLRLNPFGGLYRTTTDRRSGSEAYKGRLSATATSTAIVGIIEVSAAGGGSTRVECATQPWGIVEDNSRLRPGLTVSFAHRDGSAATVYDALTGGSPISPLVTNDNGEIPGFLEQGSYVLTVGTTTAAVTHNVEAVSGAPVNADVASIPGTSICVPAGESVLVVDANPDRIDLIVQNNSTA